MGGYAGPDGADGAYGWPILLGDPAGGRKERPYGFGIQRARKQASKHASKLASQQASKQASQQASKQASQQTSKQASKQRKTAFPPNEPY